MSDRRARTRAEWVTLTCSCLVLGVLVLLIALQLGSDEEPASPVAVVEGDRERDGFHHVDVVVTNEGDETAANVQVNAELTIDGEPSTADQVIDFLAGGEEVDLVFVFEDDPADGELSVTVGGYSRP